MMMPTMIKIPTETKIKNISNDIPPRLLSKLSLANIDYGIPTRLMTFSLLNADKFMLLSI